MIRKADNFAKFVRSSEISMRIKTGVVRAWTLVTVTVHRCWGWLEWIALWLRQGLCSELKLLARVGCKLEGQ